MKPYYEEANITIYHGDCLEIMPQLEPVDAIVTDPPFSFTGGISNGMSANASDQFFVFWWGSFCEKLVKTLKLEGSGFFWCAWKTARIIRDGFLPKQQTYTFFRVPQMIFHYREMIGQGQPFRSSIDMIAYLRGPKHKDPPITNDTPNFISEYWYYGKHDHHPSEKSASISQKLIKWCSKKEDLILDPFMGSGTTLVAAKELGRKAIGIEIEEKYCEIAVDRLRQGVFDFK